MDSIKAKSYLLFLLFACSLSQINVYASERDKQKFIEYYRLPESHPLQPYVKSLFQDPKMFRSGQHLKSAGFAVKRGRRKLLVGAHPSIPDYLIKKFPDSYSQKGQLENFLQRIKGAEALQRLIKQHDFKHIAVPQKWLYRLPSSFSKSSERAYVLIVEKMDIYDDWNDPNGEARKLYYHMDKEVLTEFCTIFHAVGGCDAYPSNQPFTHSGQIAFIDTEHVGQYKNHFIQNIVPVLNKELQAYAVALWMKLEEEEQAMSRVRKD